MYERERNLVLSFLLCIQEESLTFWSPRDLWKSARREVELEKRAVQSFEVFMGRRRLMRVVESC